MTAGERQLLYREVNDQIRSRFGEREDPLTPLDVLCECGICNELLATTLGAYDSRPADRFLTLH